MLKSDGTATSLSEFKNYLAINYGLSEVAKTFAIQNCCKETYYFTMKIS